MWTQHFKGLDVKQRRKTEEYLDQHIMKWHVL